MPSTNHRITPYPDGACLGGVVILRSLNDYMTIEGRLYLVRYLCCGKTAELTHRQVYSRVRALNQGCKSCSSKRNGVLAADAHRRATNARQRVSEESASDRERRRGRVQFGKEPLTDAQAERQIARVFPNLKSARAGRSGPARA